MNPMEHSSESKAEHAWINDSVTNVLVLKLSCNLPVNSISIPFTRVHIVVHLGVDPNMIYCSLKAILLLSHFNHIMKLFLKKSIIISISFILFLTLASRNRTAQ